MNIPDDMNKIMQVLIENGAVNVSFTENEIGDEALEFTFKKKKNSINRMSLQ
jgi:hypothetical protein